MSDDGVNPESDPSAGPLSRRRVLGGVGLAAAGGVALTSGASVLAPAVSEAGSITPATGHSGTTVAEFVAHIDQNCVGCGNCGEVADAAVLCPSFYRADTVLNSNGWDRFVDGIRRKAIGFLQRRRESRRLTFADA